MQDKEARKAAQRSHRIAGAVAVMGISNLRSGASLALGGADANARGGRHALGPGQSLGATLRAQLDASADRVARPRLERGRRGDAAGREVSIAHGSEPSLREDGETLVVKVDFDTRELLLQADPAVFFTTPHYDGYPSVLVRLAAIQPEALRELLETAWWMQAPRKLAALKP